MGVRQKAEIYVKQKLGVASTSGHLGMKSAFIDGYNEGVKHDWVERLGLLCEKLGLDCSNCYDGEDLENLISNQFEIAREQAQQAGGEK